LTGGRAPRITPAKVVLENEVDDDQYDDDDTDEIDDIAHGISRL
jgi:hypothetical protein